MPVTWEGIFDGAVAIVGVLIANACWKRTAAHGREMGNLAKIAVACGLWWYGARLSLYRRGGADDALQEMYRAGALASGCDRQRRL